MKRFLKKRFLGIPIGVIVGILLTTSIVLAAVFTLAIPSHVTITPAPPEPTYNIGVYSDEECTEPVAFIEWGSLEEGKTAEKIVYIKNKGSEPVAVTVSSGIQPIIATLEASPSPLELAVGASGACNLTLTAGTNQGNVNFSIDFDSDPQ